MRCARAVLPFRLSPSLPLPRVIDVDDVTTSVFAGRDGDTRAMSQPRYKQRERERERERGAGGEIQKIVASVPVFSSSSSSSSRYFDDDENSKMRSTVIIKCFLLAMSRTFTISRVLRRRMKLKKI